MAFPQGKLERGEERTDGWVKFFKEVCKSGKRIYKNIRGRKYSEEVEILFTQNEWFHEILSFIILYCDVGDLRGQNTVVDRNSSGIFYANIGKEKVLFGTANNLYDAFIWFHSNMEKYRNEFSEAYIHNNLRITHAHSFTANYLNLVKNALLEMPKVCLKKQSSSQLISPTKFYMLLLKASKMYSPNLFILDLDTDIANQKKARELGNAES